MLQEAVSSPAPSEGSDQWEVIAGQWEARVLSRPANERPGSCHVHHHSCEDGLPRLASDGEQEAGDGRAGRDWAHPGKNKLRGLDQGSQISADKETLWWNKTRGVSMCHVWSGWRNNRKKGEIRFPFKNNKIWGNNTTMGALLCYLACIMLQQSPACRGLQCPRSQFSSNKEIFLDPVKE